jgi:hypothetical protein
VLRSEQDYLKQRDIAQLDFDKREQMIDWKAADTLKLYQRGEADIYNLQSDLSRTLGLAERDRILARDAYEQTVQAQSRLLGTEISDIQSLMDSIISETRISLEDYDWNPFTDVAGWEGFGQDEAWGWEDPTFDADIGEDVEEATSGWTAPWDPEGEQDWGTEVDPMQWAEEEDDPEEDDEGI